MYWRKCTCCLSVQHQQLKWKLPRERGWSGKLRKKMKTAEGRRELHGEDFNIGGKEAEAERLRLSEAERLRLSEAERLRLSEARD